MGAQGPVTRCRYHCCDMMCESQMWDSELPRVATKRASEAGKGATAGDQRQI